MVALMESNHRKEPETYAEAAARLLRRLDERAKRPPVEMTGQIHVPANVNRAGKAGEGALTGRSTSPAVAHCEQGGNRKWDRD